VQVLQTMVLSSVAQSGQRETGRANAATHKSQTA
jgi:hypothetical protein